LIALKWIYGNKRMGRPGIIKEIRKLIVQMATRNWGWGYCRIQGALKDLDHRVARSTIARTLEEHGIKPSPDRPMPWRTFIKAHFESIAAADFFTTEVWTARGLVTYYTLFVIDIGTRAVHVAGTTQHPDSAFMAQVARNLTDDIDGFLRGKSLLIIDLDTKYTEQFQRILTDTGLHVVHTAYQAPNMNAYAERFVRSIKHECLSRLVLFGSAHLDRVLREYLAHYHAERTHQGLGNEIITPERVADSRADIVERERLGGLLRYYHRAAA
jgi:transposase InsO family protein